MQRATLRILQRLAAFIPGMVTNAVRQLILDLLCSLEYSKNFTTITNSVKLLGIAIHSTAQLVESYVNPVFSLLVDHLRNVQQGGRLGRLSG